MNNFFEISGTTKLTCLLGDPVAHSISPAMHNASFQKLGLDYAYLAFQVDEAHFEEAINGLITLGAAGWNCTMPLKRLMYERCDEHSPIADLCGAVNTVVNHDGKLFGDNTDGYGFLTSMQDAGFSCEGKHVVMLGSGGAAAAILAQAALDGSAVIDVFARSASASAKMIAEEAKRIHQACSCRIRLFDLADEKTLKACLSDADLLIHTSSVGMPPNEDASLIPDASFFHPGLVVGDVIYHPLETKLLRTAREAGCSTFNGLYMLLHQGAKAFERWTGQQMPVEYIRELYFK